MEKPIMKPIDEEIIAQLYAWFLEQMIHGKPVTEASFAEKSLEISKALGSPTVTVTNDWLCAFRKRYSINYENDDDTENVSPYTAVYVKEECVNDDTSTTDSAPEEDDLESPENSGTGTPVNPPESAVAIKPEIDVPATTNPLAGVPVVLNSPSCAPASMNAMTRPPAPMTAMAQTPASINTMTRPPAPMNAMIRPPASVNAMTRAPAPMNAMMGAPASINAMTRAPVPMSTMMRPPASMNAMTRPPAPMNTMMGAPATMNAMTRTPAAMNTMMGAPATMNAMTRTPAPMSTMMGAPATMNAMTRPPAPMSTMMGAPASMNAMTRTPAPMNAMAGASSVINAPYMDMYVNPSVYMNPQTYMNTFMNAPNYANTSTFAGPVTFTEALAASANPGLNAGASATNASVSGYAGPPAVNAAMKVAAPSYMDTTDINPTMNISGPPYVNTPPYMNAGPTANAAASVGAATPAKTTAGTQLQGGQNMETETEEQLFLKSFAKKLETEKISHKNIYYAKDTGLAWKAFPKKLLERCMKGENRVSLFEKERITVLLCVNAAGTNKLAPLFIHKLEKPKALKHCKDELSVIFMSQSQAQLDHDVFVEWYKKRFKPSVKIFQFPEKEGKVLLLLDNHQKDSLQLAGELEKNDNFEIVLLPPGVASLAQPIEQKVVENTKKFYRFKMLRRVLNFPGGARKFYYDFDLKDCIDLFSAAWAEVTTSTIQNAWSGIVKRSPGTCLIKEEVEDDPLEPSLRDIIGLITGEEEPEETVNEFLLRCEDTERHFLTDHMEDDEEEEEEEEDEDEDEDIEESGHDAEVLSNENVKKAFETLLTWAKQHPQYIQLQVEYLKSYFENTIKDKRVERKH
ncbi:uncharacterized protein LOC143358083 [Halictus rubicundus]|uniref:uncharacterized protein LOC143358083 n=1 Tax=Halictus rubicundus TaxID=77578 RepID=UPI00403596F4